MMQNVHARYLAVTHGLALGRKVRAKAGVGFIVLGAAAGRLFPLAA